MRAIRYINSSQESSLNYTYLKKGVWLYFFLLIFEGALRKWALPSLSEPLLIIRDPLAIWILVKVLQHNIWKPNFCVISVWGVSILAFALALIVGHGNIQVAVYGLRITLIHFPVIFIIGILFNKDDVMELGRVLLWLTIGMTILVAIQFYSPQSAWVNRGIGGDMEGSGFSGAAGFYRVPGTFSFTNGLALFYGFSAAYIFYFWIEEESKHVSRGLLIASTLALLAAIPLSISRTVLFQIAISILFMLTVSRKNPKIILRSIGAAVAGICMLVVLNSFSFFSTATMAFTERFDTANEAEGGLEGVFLDRFLGGMYGAVTNAEVPFWGLGLGMGTNVGSKLMTGSVSYLVSEGEWGRLIGEMGVVLGLSLIFIRVGFVLFLAKKSWDTISSGNFLPWMLVSCATINILQGQWAQPTSLGFSILMGGLIIASLKPD